MADGKAGWSFPERKFEEARAIALVNMTSLPDRPKGHVGILTKDTVFGKIARMAHASSTYGFIEVTVEKAKDNWFYQKINIIRRPEITNEK